MFEREWAGFFPSHKGRPATEPRLVAGLLYLQHAYRLSDEAVVARWVENPYYQHFTGETFFQHRLPIDPSSLTRWRKRIGEEGVEWMLTQTIQAGQKSGVIDEGSAKRVAVDTTVMEKNIAYPTDSRLYERAREQLVVLAQEAGADLRQSHARLAPRLALQVGRYAHAKQFKRMRKALKKLKGYTGRVMRDLRRHLDDIPEGGLRDRIIAKLALVSQLLHQQPKGSDKLYALHEPEVDCISKGKARVRYEFGCKVSVATTETVLAVAKRAGLNIPSSCNFGLCGTCKVLKTAGDVVMVHNGGISDEEVAAGMILACCSRPQGTINVALQAAAPATNRAPPPRGASTPPLAAR